MGNASTDLKYPRLIRRVRALLIDLVLFTVIFYLWIISLPALVEMPAALKILVLIIPFIILEPGLVAFTGGTPGHHIMGLRIRDASRDENIGMVRATARAVIRALLGALSLIFILVTHKHQALHDKFTSTVVVLRHPETLPLHEKFAARSEDHAQILYPSKSRRILVIFLYAFLIFIMVGVLAAFLLSQECLVVNRCSDLENIVLNAARIISIPCYGAVIVLGWRGRLYGCRRSALLQSASDDS